MAVTEQDKGLKVPIWETYSKILKEYQGNINIAELERFAFYDRAKKAAIIVQTGYLKKKFKNYLCIFYRFEFPIF